MRRVVSKLRRSGLCGTAVCVHGSLRHANAICAALIWWLSAALLLLGACCAAGAERNVEAERLFATRVLPLLKQKCFACHGDDPQDVKGELDVRSREGLLRGGESGQPAIVPGKPEASLLYSAIRWEDYEMPPKENDRLTDEQIEWVRQWIAAGAPWPSDDVIARHQQSDWNSAEGVYVPTSGGLTPEWTNRRYKPENIWAFLPVQPVRPPVDASLDAASADASEHPIDSFIDEKLRAAGIEPAGQADPRTLIRRATYDLTGLPPTPEEVERFLAEWRVDPDRAWQSLVDRLLASPQYGERWAQHWLDVTRYADTSGYSNDWERSNAWRYRDYVIRSLNQDKPYDQFVVEQLAGDELADLSVYRRTGGDLERVREARYTGDYTEQESEWIIAAGFLRMGPWEHTPMNPDKVSRQAYLDDVVNSIGQTFLSLPLRCCKCHDHKFDPIPTRDYYRIYAALATTQPAERPAPFLQVESRSDFAENRQHVERLLEFAQTERDKLYAKREAAARQWYAERGRADEYVPYQQRLKLPEGTKPPRFVGLTTEEQGILKVREQDVRIWTRRLERFEPLAQSVYNGGDLYQTSIRLRLPNPNNKGEMWRSRQLPETFIFAGGNVFSPREAVSPGVLSALQLPAPVDSLPWATAQADRTRDANGPGRDATVPVAFSPRGGDASGEQPNDPYALPSAMEGRRLPLARWIADPRNPLTTRSIVNRVWQYHVGRGLVGTPNNFGAMGKKPTHPELLDWLTSQFVAHGWSLKWLHRTIMTSQVYRRASEHPHPELLAEKDPNNDLLAVFRPRRLTAEELRDSMLAASGELNLQMGGLPVCPEINLEVALAPRMLQFSLAPAWQPSRWPHQRNRRSIYAYRVRGLADPLMEVFNRPNPNDSCELRDAPTVTPQVFAMMNSDYMIKRSIAMAVRLQREERSLEDRIRRAYALVAGEPISDSLLQTLVEHYRAMVPYHQKHPPQPTTYPTRVTRSLVEELSGDPFEYEELLDVYEHYVPDVHAADVDAQTRALADVCLLLLNSNAFMYVY